MLDYKAILVRRYGLGLSGGEIARELSCSKNGVNDFLAAFDKCGTLAFPLPAGITNEGIYLEVYGRPSSPKGRRDVSLSFPDYESVNASMKRPNMTLKYLWGKYKNACLASSAKPYSYRQFCDLYQSWCAENGRAAHFDHVPGQAMEIDFAGKTFRLADRVSGEISDIYVFVAVLPYSQYIYAEGMASIREAEWIEANNNALDFFGGVPQIVVCDNCKQAVIANKDWIDPWLNKDYAEWAGHNGTAIMAAKVRRPKYKPSVEGAVGIMEKGFFHDLDDQLWASLDDFNQALRKGLGQLNAQPFEKKEHSRDYYFDEEKKWLLALPETKYQYAERREATVSSDYHIRFDNAYYSCPSAHVHRKVLVRATADQVKIADKCGSVIAVHRRAQRKGEWVTDPSHLPADFNSYRDWSPDLFMRKASLVGPYTSKVIAEMLSSKRYQVQAYRTCWGVLSLARKHGNEALERACRDAVLCRKPNYTFVKNLILSEADAKEKARRDRRNETAYIASADNGVDALLKRSEGLMKDGGGEQ